MSALLTGLGVSSLVLVGLIGWALHRLGERRCALAALAGKRCAACKASFDDALAEWLGRPGPEVLARLDRFQRRYARWLVRCCDCGAVNLLAPDGTPFKAW